MTNCTGHRGLNFKNWSKFKSKQKFNIKKINLYQGLVSYTQIYDQKEQISAPSMWDKSFAKQRCLILTEKFFEYAKTTHIAENGRKYHDRYAFRTNQPLTLIAGIYDQDYFSMVTTAPNKDMAPIHNRMPLVVMPNELRRWLFQNFTSLIDRKSVDLQIEKMLK
ncbi:MAG: SOS response-associated peptidase [Lactobacillus crispatus]|nr:SOS response-associated peptidase [Lactobacillus crispatus]